MTLYDKLDWHEGSAIDGGFPREYGFTHIGFFLAWLIGRDLHAPSLFPPEFVALVKRGEMTGSDLSDLVDTKLVSDAMSDEGRTFADARYAAYVDEYGRLFADYPDYGVPDEPATYAPARDLLDRLHADWVAEGRPSAPPAETEAGGSFPPFELTIVTPPGYSDDHWAEVARRAEAGLPFEPLPMNEQFIPHGRSDIEALIPRDLTTPPIALSSRSAKQWGSSLLNRSLKRLGVKPTEVTVVSGVGGRGADAVMVALYAVPGVSRDRLDAEFSGGIERPPGGTWARRDIAGASVNWATGHGYAAAFWADDGLVFHLGGVAAETERLVARLLATRRGE